MGESDTQDQNRSLWCADRERGLGLPTRWVGEAREGIASVQWEKVAVHPFALAVFPIVALYVENLEKGFLAEATVAAVGAVILTSTLWLLVSFLIKDQRKSAIVVSVFVLSFLSYGHAKSAVGALMNRMPLLDSGRHLLSTNRAEIGWVAIWMSLFAAVGYVIARVETDLAVLTKLLNLVGAALIIMVSARFFAAGGIQMVVVPGAQAISRSVRGAVARARGGHHSSGEFKAFLPMVARDRGVEGFEAFSDEHKNLWLTGLDAGEMPLEARPDIYYIVPDMYIGPDYLEQMYGYDASQFLSFLENEGFYVAGRSRSNYPYTTHSLASSLNFLYINDVAQQVDRLPGHRLSAAMIQNSRLVAYLRSQGYSTVAFSTGYWFTELDDADVFVEVSQPRWYMGEFERELIGLTPLSALVAVRRAEDSIDRQRVLNVFQRLPEVGAMVDGPAFVFVHITAPHDPYVFGPNGEPIQSREGYSYDEYVEAYAGQVAYVNKRLRKVIHEILRRASEHPIIILQSDHGACYGTDYRSQIAQRMAILNAYYFPDQNYDALYEGITPVNTFRVVLNSYFGTNYELLPDRSYYASSESPYEFVDVTDEVGGAR